MEKAWFYEKLFFNVAMTVMLPEDFQEFEVIYVFLATFYSLSLSVDERSTLGKTWGDAAFPSLLVSTGLDRYQFFRFLQNQVGG